MVFKTLVILLTLEVVTSVAGPLIIPRTWYLSWYLSDKAKEETSRFLKNEGILIPDEYTGWRNRPGVEKKNWIIDENGSRSTRMFTMHRTKPVRVLFLGSSMINGGTGIRNDESISAFVEEGDVEALNFGTMMYSLDQSLLAYQYRLYRYNANVIVVGLNPDPLDGLKNHYIPFRNPEEHNMPFVKPRFKLNSGALSLVGVSPEAMLSGVPDNPDLLDFLSKNDSFYCRFETYCRMGLLPLSGGIRSLYIRSVNFAGYFRTDPEEEKILKAIMTSMVVEAEKHSAEVLFLMLPDQQMVSPSGRHRFLPDKYGRQYQELRSAEFDIIDGRQILRESGIEPEKLFSADHLHYSPMANEVIGRALRSKVRECLSKQHLTMRFQ